MKPRLRGHALAEIGQRLIFGPRLRGSVPRGYRTRLSPIHGKKKIPCSLLSLNRFQTCRQQAGERDGSSGALRQ